MEVPHNSNGQETKKTCNTNPTNNIPNKPPGNVIVVIGNGTSETSTIIKTSEKRPSTVIEEISVPHSTLNRPNQLIAIQGQNNVVVIRNCTNGTGTFSKSFENRPSMVTDETDSSVQYNISNEGQNNKNCTDETGIAFINTFELRPSIVIDETSITNSTVNRSFPLTSNENESLAENTTQQAADKIYIKINGLDIELLNVPKGLPPIEINLKYHDVDIEWMSKFYQKYENRIWKKIPREKGHLKWFYVCIWCDKKLSNFSILKHHLNKHLQISPYRCQKCDSKYSSNQSFRRHLTICNKNVN